MANIVAKKLTRAEATEIIVPEGSSLLFFDADNNGVLTVKNPDNSFSLTGGGGSAPTPSSNVKVYKALLNQNGTNPPIIVSNGSGPNTPFVDTLDSPTTFGYLSTGSYSINNNAFINGKVFCILNNPTNGIVTHILSGETGRIIITTQYMYSDVFWDSNLNNASILIEVYP